jgi:glycosyltransferase involved in cell wall biosynthesis
MAVHNAEPYLREAVNSVLGQTFQSFELIAVDDCSSDNSVRILESFDDSRISVIRNDSTRGASATRNIALDRARGEFVAILDADDVALPERLERQVEYLDSHPSVGLVGCAVYDNIDSGGNVLYRSCLPEDNETIQRTILRSWCFLHSSIMFRRVLQKQAGGYRREFEAAEDHDFILRLLDICEVTNIPEPLVRYRVNPKGLSVLTHRYINELGDAAIRLALRRRSGQCEDVAVEIAIALRYKPGAQDSGRLASLVSLARNSFYAANRYYGFGCRALCAGNIESARICFKRSLRTNALFLKAWIGFGLVLFPFAARRLRFAFRASMRAPNTGGQLVNAAGNIRPE